MPKRRSKEQAGNGKEVQGKARKETGCGAPVVPPKELSKPQRAQIVGVANQRIISPSEFAREYRKKLDEVSYDFRVLRDKGWLELVGEAPGLRGSARRMYRATKRAQIQSAEWRMFSTAVKPGFREVSLKGFVIQAVRALDAGTFDAQDKSSFAWKDGLFDDEGWAASAELLQRAFARIMEHEVASAERLASGESENAVQATFAIAAFESPPEEEPKPPPTKRPKAGVRKRSKKAKGSAAKPKAGRKPKGGGKA